MSRSEFVSILGIAGSLRRGSYNRAALRAAAALVPDGATLDTFDLEGIPGFNQDEERNPPAKIVEFKQRIRAADALLFVTPEYNYAWRTLDAEAQRAWRSKIAQLGYNITPILDRSYFQSIYFREPGGVLFEIATDVPGFAVDEPTNQLGRRLTLPGWLESRRGDLAKALPMLRGPDGQRFP